MRKTNAALKKARAFTAAGVAFKIEFLSHDATRCSSAGVKVVQRALLRPGMGADKSGKSSVLIGYKDLDKKGNRWFYAPLLLKLNDVKICDIPL
jgi:hypothetical protein